MKYSSLPFWLEARQVKVEVIILGRLIGLWLAEEEELHKVAVGWSDHFVWIGALIFYLFWRFSRT